MNCTICGLPTGNIVGSVLPQCKCGWQAPQTPTPPRQWVGLTDEEIDKTYETQVWDARRSYARAIEAKLKEKNT